MEINDKLIRARIQIQKNNPFFAYLSLYLNFKESKDLPEYAGAGINSKGDFSFRKEFIEALTNEEVKGVIIHELLHLGLLHLLRLKERDMEKWNIACDIVVNQIIKDNNFDLPTGILISDGDKKIDLGELGIISDCDKKTAEEIYDELMKSDKSAGKPLGFDKHFQDEKMLTNEEKEKAKKIWVDRLREAYISSKLAGKVPAGIERLIGDLHKEKINWREYLKKYILNYIPYDYTYSKPNKKSVSSGFYMPDMIREKIEVVIGIDVSGSIGEKELNDFISEIVGMAKAYKNKIDMTLITHETDVNDVYKVENGNIDKIKQLEIKGGGGTAHEKVFEYIKNNIRDCVVAVFLTDGCSDLENINMRDYRFDKIFAISNGGNINFSNKEMKIVQL